ncbi:hypothetical protein DEO72_LG3g147 [Vigna unguiculata]|uniref:Uncharacterized protein n=1 Tax=Vigna unguiculata TaxID=3917 RepID=A0A4D6LAR3_VIGUN|nr:hypothetical protein DEO72_LG3g147 [Vigna unguiculata]
MGKKGKKCQTLKYRNTTANCGIRNTKVAFQKLASPQILDFFRVRKLDQKLLFKLETKLHSIHSLADDAERKQFTDPHVRSWLLKVKNAVLDAEDLLDDIQMLSKRELDDETESQAFTGCTCKYVGGDIYFRWEVGQKEKIQKETRHFSVELDSDQNFDGFETPCNTERLRTFMRTANNVKKMPMGLGKLKNLIVLMESFNVGHGKEFGIQQLGELNLDGSLSIGELQNIENSVDASEAYLKNKTLLVKLKLQWRRNWDSIDSKKEEEVIKNLQPSENLKELAILEYGGKQFPNWLHSLPYLVSLELNGCKSCERLPPLGLLPFLEDLSIDGLDGIVSIDADFYGSNSSSFKSLQRLVFSHMRQWKKWECKGVFPRLQYLTITSCPKLKGELPKQLIPLKTLYIRDCQQLEASAPRALDLMLYDCGKLHLDWATIKILTMEASFLEIVWSNTIEYLCIFWKSISDDCVSLRIFPLDFFPTLKRLELIGFPNLQMISVDHIHNHLERMRIIKCPKFESLPANMHMLLPSLNDLNIEQCPKLEPFIEGALPSNLKIITLNNCSRLLVDSLKGAFKDIASIERLFIEKVDVECFSDEGVFPLSLTELYIRDCPNLEKLDYEVSRLSSLQSLTLNKCPNLQYLPKQGLPKSISYLYISSCPLLKQRCQKERGEDWEKISHIQRLYILE